MCAILIGATTPPQKPTQEPTILQRISGGPFDGLSVGRITLNDKDYYQGMLPSQPDASPVPDVDKAAVAAFIAGHADTTQPPLLDYLAPDARLLDCLNAKSLCRSTPVTSITFNEDVVANTPYYQGNDHVRVEWMYGRALYYISYLILQDGKIASVETKPAIPPVAAPPNFVPRQ